MKILQRLNLMLDLGRNRLFQARLAQAYETPANDALPPLDSQSMDRMWINISALLEPSREVRLEKPPQRMNWLFPTGGFALAAAAAMLGYVLTLPAQVEIPQEGLKSAPAKVITVQMPALRFALVADKEEVVRGENNMEVSIGNALIFSVESDILPKDGALISIHYRTPSGATHKLIGGYPIQKGKNFIEGKSGFIAFTPEEVGAYTFYLAEQAETPKGKTIQFAGEVSAGRFTVSVTK